MNNQKWVPTIHDQITDHPNWLSTLTIENVVVHLVYNGDPVQMFLFWNDELILNHTQYDPRFSQDKATLEVMADALAWLTLSENCGAEIIEDYNEKQLEWSRSDDCEYLRMLANDFDSSEDEYANAAKIELNAGFYHC